jgi:hypothetical protein
VDAFDEPGVPPKPPPPPPPTSIVPGLEPLPAAVGPADGAWAFGSRTTGGGGGLGKPESRVGQRTKAIALGLVVLLVGAAAGYLLFNRRSTPGTALALSFSQGQQQRYRLQIGFNGTLEANGRSVPFDLQVAETFGWRVTSVDPGGIATLEMTIESVSGTINGQKDSTGPEGPFTVRIASDGRIVSGSLGGVDASDPISTAFEGTDQVLPFLPDHPVKPGDSWHRSSSQDLPFGMGTMHYDSSNRLLRYEDIEGVRAAVITSHTTVPMNLTVDMRTVLKAMGTDAGIPDGTNPTMRFGGSMSLSSTSWLDTVRREVVKTTGTANMNITIDLADFPASSGLPSNGQLGIGGVLTMSMTRQASAPSGAATGDQTAQATLRDALAAAKTYAATHHGYGGLTATALGKLAPTHAFSSSSKAKVGVVDLHGASGDTVVLVTKSQTGTVFCIADGKSGVSYGRRNATKASACSGGW